MPAVEVPAELHALVGLLNQTLRRLKQYASQPEWTAALLDGAAPFVEAAALFAFEGGRLQLRGAIRLDLADGLTFEANRGQAFQAAIETRDTVIALRTPGEVTPPLGSADLADRAVVVPILNGKRVVAVLFAAVRITDRQAGESPALELVAGMASLVLERSANSPGNVQIAPAQPVASAGPTPKLPYWTLLGEEQRRLHIRAQRFARVKVAEMELYQPEGCRAGREQNDVYLFLKKEIDAARESYREQFLLRPGMEDYLHLELVRTIADGREDKLGVDYPGQLG